MPRNFYYRSIQIDPSKVKNNLEIKKYLKYYLPCIPGANIKKLLKITKSSKNIEILFTIL